MAIFLWKGPLMPRYWCLGQRVLDFRWGYLDVTSYIVRVPLQMTNPYSQYQICLHETGKANTAVKWRIMDIHVNWGCSLGTLPGYTFMSSLKKCFIYQQLLVKQVLNDGGCYIKTINHLDQKHYQDTMITDTNYPKRSKVFVGSLKRYGTY